MERWGVFSVLDHRDPIRLATDVLLYDRLAIPTPEGPKDGREWQRWRDRRWDPDALEAALTELRKGDVVRETTWDADRQAEWQQIFDEARAAMNKANNDAVEPSGNAIGGHDYAGLRRLEQALPYQKTREAIIRHLRGKQQLWHGAVEFYAAYQSAETFAALHPQAALDGADARRLIGVPEANVIIASRLAVPVEAPADLLKRAVALSTSDTFRRRRRLFYDWQNVLLERGHPPGAVARELEMLVNDYNRDIEKQFGKVRWERAFTVMAVLGAAGGAAAAFAPALAAALGIGAAEALKGGIAVAVAGNAATIAVGKLRIVTRDPDGPARVAAAGAMFHDIDERVGFAVRTSRALQ